VLLEEMEDPPSKGDRCRVRYTGYDPTGRSGLPVREGVGEYLGMRPWDGSRWQQGFRFEGGEEVWIYDDHDVFECEVLERSPALWEEPVRLIRTPFRPDPGLVQRLVAKTVAKTEALIASRKKPMIKFGVLNMRTGELRTFLTHWNDYNRAQVMTTDVRDALVTCAGAGRDAYRSLATTDESVWELGDWRTLTKEESEALGLDVGQCG
jgi:hypothetical protein